MVSTSTAVSGNKKESYDLPWFGAFQKFNFQVVSAEYFSILKTGPLK
jgi:hypothetical protein